MRKDIIIVGLGLLVLISSGCITQPRYLCPTGETASNPDLCPKTTTTPPTTTRTLTTFPPPTEPPIEYVDASRGGTYKSGDKISYLGIKGKIMTGKIVDGEVVNDTLILTNEKDEVVLKYNQYDKPDFGHVEMISYPQRGEKGEVYIKIGGVDSGYRIIYTDKGLDFYLTVISAPEEARQMGYLIE